MTDSLHPNIHAALAAVMGDIEGYVKKVKSGGLNYSFASVDDIIAEVRPIMVQHGVVCYPSGVRDLKVERYTNDRNTAMTSVSAVFAFTFAHASGDRTIVEVPGEGRDSSDKAHNKALTAAYKYALKQTFMIETGDAEKPQRQPRKPAAQPLNATDFKKAMQQFVQTNENNLEATTDQAKFIASLMNRAYRNVPQSTDGDRFTVLSWLVDRAITSGQQLTRVEATFLLDRLADGNELSATGNIELLALYAAAVGVKEEKPLDVWTADTKKQFWADVSWFGLEAQELYSAANVSGAGAFFAACSRPSKAYDLLRETVGDEAYYSHFPDQKIA